MNPIHDPAMSRPTSSGLASPSRRSRTQSISSDRPSVIAHSLMSPPLSVSPEAAFIAASAASQIVTNDHDSHADTWYDQHGIEPAGETALVSPGALQLVNNFLDQLLFNILHVSRATTLQALRPAVSEVLKPKLAKDAINNADEELREYLGGGDEDDFVQPHGADPNGDWDLELVWKRTRLRCMVYSSLGDMEEEDEDYYMEQEDLEPLPDEPQNEVISPAVAIFLTSVLEYMGETALTVAGKAAYHRMRSKLEKELRDGVRGPSEIADRIVVEELDMERVALDRTLGRLWRAWKKRIRSPTLDGSSRPFSSGSSRSHMRQQSLTSEPLPPKKPEEVDEDAETQQPKEVDEETLAASIPLPIGDRDVDEIEVPGLVSYSDDEDDEETEDEDEPLPPRPKSILVIPMTTKLVLAEIPARDDGDEDDNEVEPEMVVEEPDSPIIVPRKRSNSLPTLWITVPKRQRRQVEDQKDGEEADAEAEAEADAGDDKTATSKKQKKRLSKITTNMDESAENSGDDVDGDEDIAEFEIMTSSRVSIGGTSPVISESSKMPSRSNSGRRSSVHPARLIDVAGPKSPVMRAHTPSSDDGADAIRHPSARRSAGLATSPVVEDQQRKGSNEKVLHTATSNAATLSPVEKSTRSAKTQFPIEDDEAGELSARAESTPTTATISTPTSATMPAEVLTSQIKNSHAIFGSVVRGHPPASPRSPRSPQSPRSPVDEHAPTKVTIISTSNSTGAFVEPESLPEVPPKSRGLPPQVRDRASSKSMGNTSPTSIGMVSVERRDSETTPLGTSGITPRQIHTSGSSGSTGTNRFRPVRTSEESGSNRADVARNFEELIHSDQTITYTLTPESMRDIEASRTRNNSSPVMTVKTRMSEDRRSGGDRSRSSSNADAGLKRTTSVSRAMGLSSHPVQFSATAQPPSQPPQQQQQQQQQQQPKLNGPIPRAPASMGGNRTRIASYQARDARVPRESMVEFADFIRNTGPPGEPSPPTRSSTAPAPAPLAKDSFDIGSRTSMASSRTRLQARDAAIDNREDNSDLIDFIRRGPPGGGGSNPRIPRTVAPFRTTMDSDQMSGAVGGRAIDANLPNIRYSQASTNNTMESMAAPSMHSSINSQSALLKSKPSYQNGTFDDEDMMPKRKTRRVKDPYAIDLSDEDDEDLVPYGNTSRRVQPKPAPKEESLADFLKNYDPPPSSEPMPFDLSGSGTTRPKKKSSAPSLMGRFGRGGSSTATNGTYTNGSNGATNGRGYIPIQVNMPPGYDKYGPIGDQPTGVPKSNTGRVQMKKFEPRDPVPSAGRSATADLADFLRNSGPPGNTLSPQYSPSGDDDTGFPKAFGRRKKSAYA